MSIVKSLPCGGGVDVTYKVLLEGKYYDLRFEYLQRESNVALGSILADQWSLYLGLSGKDPFIKTDLKTNRDILERIRYHPDCPEGVIELRDSVADTSLVQRGTYDPERVEYGNLGQQERYRLYYFPQEYFDEGNAAYGVN